MDINPYVPFHQVIDIIRSQADSDYLDHIKNLETIKEEK